MAKGYGEAKDERVKGMMEAMRPPKGNFKNMDIDGAENGVSIRTTRVIPSTNEGKEGSKGAADNAGMSAPTLDSGDKHESITTVHSNLDDAMDHVRKHLSGHFGK